jgi:transposase
MWTKKYRARYNRDHLHYPSDLTDEVWALVEPLIPPAKRGGNKRSVVIRNIVNGILYALSTGCQRRAVPKELEKKMIIHDYCQRMVEVRTRDRLPPALYELCRDLSGREANPAAAIINSQNVKSAEKGGPRLTRQAMMQAE